LATTDRRTLGAQTEDKAIAVKAETRMPQLVGDAGHVNINSYNRKVLLTGEVRDDAMKRAVENEVRSIANVDNVINELEVAGPSSYTSRSSDTLITSKVKISLADKKTVSRQFVQGRHRARQRLPDGPGDPARRQYRSRGRARACRASCA
jgi:osmotically-inducible protein OsmY